MRISPPLSFSRTFNHTRGSGFDQVSSSMTHVRSCVRNAPWRPPAARPDGASDPMVDFESPTDVPEDTVYSG